MFGGGIRMNVHSPMDRVDAGLKDEDARARRRHDRARRGGRGGPGHVDDVAIGDEDQDLTRVDIDNFKADQQEKDQMKNRFNVNYVIAGGMLGALMGSLLGALQINKLLWEENATINYEVATSTMWGLLLGTTFGAMVVSTVMACWIFCNKDARWKAEQAARLEALRRKEQEMIERHDEFVYYDARRGQNRCCKTLCCFHYGKITSERIIYSANPAWPPNGPRVCAPSSWCRGACRFAFVRRLCCGGLEREVEALDYDLIFDISVDQKFYQCCTNTGSIIIHCEAAMDVSMQKTERKRIIRAMQDENEKDLMNALYTAGNIRPLAEVCAEGRKVLQRLQDARREKCKAEGKPYKIMHAMEATGTNTSKNITVRDVVNPYAVMDDISYRIAKHQQIDQRNRLMNAAAPMSSRQTVGTEVFDRQPPSAGEAKLVK